MVGIVLVSHSYDIARGTADLARQMGGDEVSIEIAGGLDLPDHPIGTDAALVAGAIDRAWSDEGVLVLMDLGSAVLSAEMALDLLEGDRRGNVRLTVAPFVEGAVAAAVTARLGESLERVAQEAAGGLAPKVAHLEEELAASTTDETAVADGGVERSISLTVTNPHGLHARPAARLVQTASAFGPRARVSVWNRTSGRGPADARSLNAVATLGVGAGDRIEVTAFGPEADAAIEAIRQLAGRNFDDVPEPDPTSSRAQPAGGEGGESEAPTGAAVQAIPASPGTAVGPVWRFRPPELEVPDAPLGDPEEELRRLDAALEATRADIAGQGDEALRRVGPDQASIFDAHALFLDDPALLDPARTLVRRGRPAAAAWRDVIEEMAATWEHIEDPYLRARGDDLRSVGRQVLVHLLGARPLPHPDGRGVLVVDDLAPADALLLDARRTIGVVTALGGPTSHAALLARSIGIPAVVGAGRFILEIPEGTVIGLDGGSGAVFVDPPADVIRALARARTERDGRMRAAGRRSHEPAVTADGVTVEVAANIGTVADVAAALAAGADGIGLFRTELLFMESTETPDEEVQERAYREVAEALEGRPLVVRTLDVGADKPLPYAPQPAEANPFLGVRGVRLSLAFPDLLETQLRALVRVGADHPVHIMFPMVATLDELRRGREAVARAREAVAAGGGRVGDGGQVGIMIEVPAAALTADALAAECDFFSVGTNDLTQYTLAADRGNGQVAPLADPMHPAVLQLIGRSAEAAAAHGRWIGVCGELAGDPSATPLLLGLGVRELSLAPPAIGAVKEAVRATDLRRARDLAARALILSSAAAVRELVAGAEQ